MAYKVQLTYFRQTGKFLTRAEMISTNDVLMEIWEEVDDLRRLGQLPSLRPGAGRDLFILVDVTGHPERTPHLVMPPFVDDDDVTPPRTPTGEMMPLVRVPLSEIPRTTTRDVVKRKTNPPSFSDEEKTPVDGPLPKPPKDDDP